jgi:hypothetical protein
MVAEVVRLRILLFPSEFSRIRLQDYDQALLPIRHFPAISAQSTLHALGQLIILPPRAKVARSFAHRIGLIRSEAEHEMDKDVRETDLEIQATPAARTA